jgi:predicted nucleic acid-binding protein
VAWLDDLRGQLVAFDTAPLIYFIEHHPTYYPRVMPFFAAVDRGDFALVTSTVTLLEVLVYPLRRGQAALVQQYRAILLNARNVRSVPVTPPIAAEAARLRAVHKIAPVDAIQLATAAVEGAVAFLTNDRRLPHLPAFPLLSVDDL